MTHPPGRIPASTPTGIRSDIPAAQVHETGRTLTHDGFFRMQRIALRHPLFGGGMSCEVAREVFVATDAAIVLPYDPQRDRVLLVEQFRAGPYGRGDALPFCLEPVAGRVDAGEAPETAARRECAEEAGLALRDLRHVSSHYPSPGCSTEYFHCYVGLCDLPEPGQGRGGLETENEDIRTHVIPFDAAQGLLETGEANVGPLVLLLTWLAHHRASLRQGA